MTVWVASIDIGDRDGRPVLEPVHAFSNAGAAEDYRQWKEDHGDRCYIAEVAVRDCWES